MLLLECCVRVVAHTLKAFTITTNQKHNLCDINFVLLSTQFYLISLYFTHHLILCDAVSNSCKEKTVLASEYKVTAFCLAWLWFGWCLYRKQLMNVY